MQRIDAAIQLYQRLKQSSLSTLEAFERMRKVVAPATFKLYRACNRILRSQANRQGPNPFRLLATINPILAIGHSSTMYLGAECKLKA
jgi:hypothetical protein